MPLVLKDAEDTVEFGRMLAEAMSASPVRSLYLFADLGGAHQRGILARNGAQLIHQRIALLFLGLDHLPIGEDLCTVLYADVTEHVRMTMYHLCRNVVNDLTHCKAIALRLDLCMENDLEQQISQLLLQKGGILVVDRLDHLVGFLDQLRADAVVILLTIPRASVFRA